MDKYLVRLLNAGLFIPGDKTRAPVLRNINWNIAPRSHWVVSGPNGAGKSTLLRLLHGDLWLSEGSIEWLGTFGYETSPIIGHAISALVSPAEQEKYQRLGWALSPGEMFGAEPEGSEAAKTSSHELIRRLGGLDLWETPISRLSQGQLRLVLLALAISRRPKLLLLDEYGAGLDTAHKKLLFEELERIAGDTAMVFTTHHPGSLPAWVNNTCYLRNGTLHFGASQVSEQMHFSLPQPADNNNFLEKPDDKSQVPFLTRVTNADVYIDSNLTLRGINWTMRPGEHWRISGENGSGKSTFLRLLAGDEIVAVGGRVERLNPKTGAPLATLDDVRRDFCLVSDLGQALYGYPLSGLELVCSGFDNSVGIYRDISEAEKARAQELVEMFFGTAKGGLLAKKSIRQLSSGQLRGLHLCRSLVNRPSVLLLDEPCTGLDVETRQEYLALLDRLVLGAISGYKPQLVFVSHYRDDAPSCLNREAVMAAGSLSVSD